MKVRCIYNEGSYLSQEMGFNKETTFALKMNKEYLVYAMTIHKGYVWYCLCDENYTYHPNWHPCPLFEVIDGSLSHYWIFSYNQEVDDIEASSIWAYPEWANDPYYYDYLFDGGEKEVKTFKRYKELMYLEFPDESITHIAQIGDDEWLICPNCIDAWCSDSSQDALVKCPNCLSILQNPRYQYKSSKQ